MKTTECADVTCFSASAVKSGKPATTPSATMVSENKSPRFGQGARNAVKIPAARIPAIEARAKVTKSGSKSATAARVAGREALKIKTPMNPLIQPLEVSSWGVNWESNQDWRAMPG